MTTELKPFGIEGNPIMQGAFASFCHWIFKQDRAHEEFCEDTGMVRTVTGGLAGAIDKATGYDAEYAAKFLDWAVRTHWGEEEKGAAQ